MHRRAAKYGTNPDHIVCRGFGHCNLTESANMQPVVNHICIWRINPKAHLIE